MTTTDIYGCNNIWNYEILRFSKFCTSIPPLFCGKTDLLKRCWNYMNVSVEKLWMHGWNMHRDDASLRKTHLMHPSDLNLNFYTNGANRSSLTDKIHRQTPIKHPASYTHACMCSLSGASRGRGVRGFRGSHPPLESIFFCVFLFYSTSTQPSTPPPPPVGAEL